MRVVIRVDSSTIVGSGHLMRCLTMAQQLKKKDGADIIFICRDLEGNLSNLINEKGFELVFLPRVESENILDGYAQWLTVTQEKDAEETLNVLKGLEHVDRVVVDSYAIDEAWEKVIRPYSDEIFVIDDLANRKHDCDVLLDQNFYLNKEHRYDGLVPASCKLLLGPEHALLREEFAVAKENMLPRKGQLHKILVFYGGMDMTNETSKAINALKKLISDNKLSDVFVTVVVGESNSRKNLVADLCKEAGFKYLCQVDNMAALMADADLMLGAGGTTTWERCYLGLPAVVTAVADNQIQICEDCAKAGLIYYLGRCDEVTEDNIIQSVDELNIQDNLVKLQKSCILSM